MSHLLPLLLLVLELTLSASPRIRTDDSGRTNRPRIAAGDSFTCHVLADGTVKCWGANDRGQLGDGTVIYRTNPVRTGSLSGVVSVAAGGSHACALQSNGRVRCWGENSSGQLGDGTSTQRLSPVLVSGLTRAVGIAAGREHTCAILADGSARCWGSNADGQLGRGDTVGSSTPVVVTSLQGATGLAAGTSHTCALIANGQVRCWGRRDDGKLGDLSTVGIASTPLTVQTLTRPTTGIVAGNSHTCAVADNGSVSCWGGGGAIGDGLSSGARTRPRLVGSLGKVALLAGGSTANCAVLADGTVRCWGGNSSGQLGVGSQTDLLAPETAVIGVSNAVEVAVGSNHTCILDALDTVRCSGLNNLGQLGNGSNAPSTTPAVTAGLSGSTLARSVSTGGRQTCAGRANSTVACWGSLESGTTANPVAIQNLADAVLVRSTSLHSCALRANGRVMCWGSNTFGQLGNGTQSASAAPVEAVGLQEAVSIAVGGNHTCALKADGKVFCWGSNQQGQLGGVGNSLVPREVSGIPLAISVTAGIFHSCALGAAGDVYCWGRNANGQLGRGSLSESSDVPAAVPGLSNIVALSSGPLADHTCAVDSGGTLRCWGENGFGQIGDSTTADRSTQTTVGSIAAVTAVSAGDKHTCAVTAEGRAECWGSNVDRQLAAQTTNSYLTPTPVIFSFATINGQTIPQEMTGIKTISAGGQQTCVLGDGGAPYCWGGNSYGQIGDGTFNTRTRPFLVPSFTANVMPAVSVRSNGRIATVTAFASCPIGARIQFFLTLRQGNVVGNGVDTADCSGGLEQTAVTVPAVGPAPFQPGAGTADIEAIVRLRGEIISEQKWSRAVVISTVQ